jgi:cytochrome c-type protein NapC
MPFLVPLLALLGIALVLVLGLTLRPEATRQPGGKILAFVAIFLLPALGLWMGFETHVEQAKQRDFCLSCHVMKPYGKSLYVDDDEYVPAAHFQNNRVDRETACYTCHTTYAMFGDVEAKLRGLRHLMVFYSGSIPDTIKLYSPYNNRECLHCHSGARRFEKNSNHHEADTTMAAMKANRLSCMTSGCHDVIHDVHALDDADLWDPSKPAYVRPKAAHSEDDGESGEAAGEAAGEAKSAEEGSTP